MSMVVVCGRPRPWPVSNGTGGGGGGLVPDITADSGSTAHVQAMLDWITTAGPGKIGLIPDGTWPWTSGITWTAPANTIIIGAGSLSTLGGGDVTTIIDDYISGLPLLNITIAATGTFRLAGLTMEGGTGSLKENNGLINILGPGEARLDHLHMDIVPYADNHQPKIIRIGDRVYGVMDHCIIDSYLNAANYVYNGAGTDGAGNTTWAAATGFGGANFFFFEDNEYNSTVDNPSRILDIFSAGRAVARFNTLIGCAGIEIHATGHAGDDRGARAFEQYGNHFVPLVGQANPAYDMADCSSGCSLVWGNEADTDALKNGMVFNVTRKNNDTYNRTDDPDDWGYACGTRTAGTVNVAANGVDVTRASGTNFNTAWPSGHMIRIDGGNYKISSVSSVNALTLQGAGTGGALTGSAYVVGSNWDGNTDVRGYPCLDQTGRGQCDLISGYFPSKGTPTWPNQALEPVYVWKNIVVPHIGYGGSVYVEQSLGRVVANRDYYPQASGIQTNATTPFNGTSGCGWGTIANRPTTCTVGVAYFAIDEGSWNTSGSNPEGVNFAGASGRLYKCLTTNVWTLYYTPYTYPHPLNT